MSEPVLRFACLADVVLGVKQVDALERSEHHTQALQPIHYFRLG